MNIGARHLTRELYRRVAYQPPRVEIDIGARSHRYLQKLFRQQIEFIDDPDRYKAGFCTRRAGKTTLVASYFAKTMDENPRCLCTFYAITRLRAKQLVWEDLKLLNREYGLGYLFNETELEVRAPNGSILRLTGADKIKEALKKLGDKNKLVILDEAQLYPEEVLRVLIDRVITPTLMDHRGTVCLMGTPGIVLAGLWWEITKNEASERQHGYSVHSWSVLDNPHIPHAAEEIEAVKARRKVGEDDPDIQREYRGRWVNDSGALFYAFEERRNGFVHLPEGKHWQYVMGVDLGEKDAFATNVWAFSMQSRDIYSVDQFKQSGLLPTEWRKEIKARQDKYHPIATVVDPGGLGSAFIKEMETRYRMPVKAAEKSKKAAFVKMMNDDFKAGRIHLDKGSEYAGELKVLGKNKDKPLEEDPRCENHLCDAGLYGWREALHYLGAEPDEEPPPGSPEANAKEEARIEREFEERARVQHEQATQEAVFGWEKSDFGDRDDAW